MQNRTLAFHTVLLMWLLNISTGFATDNTALLNSLHGAQRSEQNRVRDMARHPLQTLQHLEVNTHSTVMEMWPGKGWYTEILAPAMKQGDGHYIAAGFPLHDGPEWRQHMQQALQDDLSSKPQYYDAVHFIEIGPPSYWSLGEDNSADTVLTFRNVHNWVKGGYEDKIFQAMFNVLKSGGVLGVIDHRAKPNTDIESMKRTGYMTEQYVIKLAQQAGFILESTSEINANPNDTKDYAKGVWTLPPTLRLGDESRDQYLAIGESDRMTLKFRKP